MYCESVPRPTARTTVLTVGIRPRKQRQNVIGVVMWSENGKRGKKDRQASDKNGQTLARLWVLGLIAATVIDQMMRNSTNRLATYFTNVYAIGGIE